MRLSMWMIANRLHALEPEVNIKSDAPMELRGARNVMAPNCVHVYEKGNYVYIQYGEDYIRLHDIEYNYVFNIVQGIFEFYNDWTEMVQQAIFEMDFQKLLDECWFFVGNPVILLDGNNRCLAMCSQYADDEVDSEWSYVAKNKYSSLNFIKKMRRSYPVVDMYRKNSVQLLRKEQMDVYYDTLTTAIYYQDYYCGRLNVLAKEREFNYGDIQVLEYILKIITPSLYMLQNQDNLYLNKNVFHDLLKGKEVSANLLKVQLDYLDWKAEDVFQVCLITVAKEYQDVGSRSLISNQIRRNTANVYVTTLKDAVMCIFNLRFVDREGLTECVKQILHKDIGYTIGFSNPMRGLDQLIRYYEQAQAAITYGKLLNPKKHNFYFYDYALYYMLENSDVPRLYCAMNSDIKMLDELDRTTGSGWLQLLRCFFDNECSLVNTAKAAFVHRNTLVYRLNKLSELMHYDWHNNYDRDYMKQSILLLDFYRKKYGKNADLLKIN
ncbi:PucR family transcriptional regulator [Lachnospiraceae bacterium OF09-6]|nr:PucR family transcriptional regulator [Lachnospiraceae bacterium OF09-6]